MSGRHAAGASTQEWVEQDPNQTDWLRPMRPSDWAFVIGFATAALFSLLLIPALVGPPDYAAGLGEVQSHAFGIRIMQVVIGGGLALTSLWYILLRKSPKAALAVLAAVIGLYGAHVVKDRQEGWR